MIKKALILADFEDVPVVTLPTNLSLLNDQPGFKFNTKEYMCKAAIGMMFTDALSAMYHSTIIREKNKISSQLVADKHLNAFMNGNIHLSKNTLLKALENGVNNFSNIGTTSQNYPKVGFVGEIYVKYNAFSNNYAAQWLIDQGIEVVMPSFFEFFAGGIVTIQHSAKTNIKRRDSLWLIMILGQKLAQNFLKQFDTIMQRYCHYHPSHNIKDVAGRAEEILSLNHQYGEGWLIAGETASLVEDGIKNVLCLQPFGCIVNHVIAKGVQKKLQKKYPELNILFLDVDEGVSEVNFFNRMHFFIDHAKNALCDKSKKLTMAFI